MPAPKGNRFWEQRTKHGRDSLISDPEALWAECVAYFEWTESNPLMSTEAKTVSMGQGEGSSIEMVELPRMRPFTLVGLCLYLDIAQSTWQEWRKREDLSAICARADAIIYRQKFEGASSGFFNANIIARDLGLADKKELTGADGGPIATEANNTTTIRFDPDTLRSAMKALDDAT